MTHPDDKKGGLTLSPEFEKLIDKAVDDALKKHVKEEPKLPLRLTEAVIAGFIASCIWAAATQHPFGSKPTTLVVAQNQAEVTGKNAEAKN